MKRSLHMQFLEVGVPNFHSFRSMRIHFKDIAHFSFFPIDSNVNVSKCYIWHGASPIAEK